MVITATDKMLIDTSVRIIVLEISFFKSLSTELDQHSSDNSYYHSPFYGLRIALNRATAI